MASKRRIRRKSCDGKRRYAERRDAQRARHSLVTAPHFSGGFIDAYKCHFCNGYHLGHRGGIRPS